MSTIMDSAEIKIKSSKSVLAVERPDGIWVRYLTIEGKKAYTIGVICGTCQLLFERMEGANQVISADELSDTLATGVTKLNDSIIQSVSALMPIGEYKISLLKVSGDLVKPGSEADYFVNEQLELWGVESFWGLPHYPKVEYYRSPTTWISKNNQFFELTFPMLPPYWADKQRVEEYKDKISSGIEPTAIAISFLDIKQPANWEGDPEINKHKCLVHLLIDGHHKMLAAAQLGKPITLLSFLAVDQSVSTEEQINEVLDRLSTNT